MSFQGSKITAVCIAVAALAGATIAGCASGTSAAPSSAASTINEPITPNRVPAAAKIQSSGTGEQTFRAPSHGRVWLFDDDRKSVLYSTLLNKGDRLALSPRLHKATLNGDDVGLNDIFDRNAHAIYFLALAK
jgi:hypothetical protein